MKYHLVAGNSYKAGVASTYFSPIDQKEIGKNPVTRNRVAVENAFLELQEQEPVSRDVLIKSLLNLSKEIKKRKLEFAKQITQETGYILKDSNDIVEDTSEFLDNFKEHIEMVLPKEQSHEFYLSKKAEHRRLNLRFIPYGIVAALYPQNSPLILETIVLANALYSGNSVVIKPSRQTFGTSLLLIEALKKTFPRDILKKISIINCEPKVFLETAYVYAGIIHFIGSSKYAPDILLESFKKSKKVLIDGEGGSYVIIDKTANLERALRVCRDGIIRCNGELCTSIRGIFIHTKVYEKFTKVLRDKLSHVKVGNPLKPETEMGPLFSKEQVDSLKVAVPGIKVLAFGPNYIKPAVVADDGKNLRGKSLYGPVCFLVPYANNEWKEYLAKIPYPITLALFTHNGALQKEIVSCGISPRVVINADPSRESPFEPWGSFPPSGLNEVNFWVRKYLKAVQIDESF